MNMYNMITINKHDDLLTNIWSLTAKTVLRKLCNVSKVDMVDKFQVSSTVMCLLHFIPECLIKPACNGSNSRIFTYLTTGDISLTAAFRY